MNRFQIAFLGIGLMGLPMCKNLLRAGYKVRAWNRTAEKSLPLKELGAEIAETPHQAVNDADVVISMLENGPVVNDVLINQGTALKCKPQAIIVDMSSIPPDMAKEHAAYCQQHDLQYMDAPVSGGTVGAEEATLTIMAGGETETFETLQPIFNTLGKSSTYIGPAGSGQLAKCANQAIVGITIGAVSEALLLAAKGGADPAAVREALLGGFASSRILDLHGQRMIDRNFNPGARATVQLKDLRTILDTAQNNALSLPLTQRTYDEYLALVNNGNHDVDHSGLLLQLEQLNNCQMSDKETQKP